MNNLKNKTILVTGSAGFIGSNLVKELLRTNEEISIIGFDSVNDYYDGRIERTQENLAKLRLDHAEAQKNKAKGRGKQGTE